MFLFLNLSLNHERKKGIEVNYKELMKIIERLQKTDYICVAADGIYIRHLDQAEKQVKIPYEEKETVRVIL